MNLLKICLALALGFVLGYMLRPSTASAFAPPTVYVQKVKVNGPTTATGGTVIGFSCSQSGDCYIASK